MITQNLIFLTTSSLFILSLLHNLFQTCNANSYCSPSACGIFPNISSPFHLKGDPSNCGDRRVELACENNVTSIYLNSHKYYVKAINYSNAAIRLVDASINNDDICSFPTVSLYQRPLPCSIPRYSTSPINFVNCPNPLANSSLFTDITNHCASNSSLPTPRYAYIKVGHMNASELPHRCAVHLIVLTSWHFKDLKNVVSLSEIHQSLLYGFELVVCPSWFCAASTSIIVVFFYSIIPILLVIIGLLCAAISPPVFTIFGFAAVSYLLYYAPSLFFNVIITDQDTRTYFLPALVLSIIIFASRIITFPLAAWLLIYKFRTRHLSLDEGIESFLHSDNNLTPIRYSYSDLKKITQGFRNKLGQGGYGSVYKGKLRSGLHVAVKLLEKSGGNGKDFMNEIATIGRIHHVNVVNLVGYCAHGSKRALVYDFMPNGSLEKYLFNREKMNLLNWNIKFEIAVGVARGIEYLHRGYDVQILHFDIKPHNILLDHNFNPKISDFGLAKLCSTDKKTVTMTAVRGTIGYVAPELISRSIGAVSNKADVYSFGMLLVEMVGLKRDLSGNNGDSTKYFPYWIYDCFNQGNDIEIGNADENDSTRKVGRKMTIVALWCIQMNPDDRPSMNKILEMLEGDVERLQIPNYPSQSTQIVDETGITYSTYSISSIRDDDLSSSMEITVQQ
ncbi:rust resistance kinase Lr10-like [Salvia miltiorrhiza]|uniref:rust resistance kinase Lr10-like n=1 Tax=Salvia miltiorrhiza TaxID=226208 RepID=UPI0025AD3399|nr:rust resistance kinase Lr10-like [Salvia miltiorrhiza]